MIKLFHLLIITLLLGTGACNNSLTLDNKNSNNAGKTFEALYEFAETADKNFCNPDSIIPTDCLGDFYFTKNGNVVYTFSCLGGDTTSYLIGKYTISGNEIVCIFNRTYSFYNGYSDDESPKRYDANAGIMKDSQTYTVELKKIDCKKYEFSFSSINNNKYVLYKSNLERSKYFFDDYKKIKSLSDL